MICTNKSLCHFLPEVAKQKMSLEVQKITLAVLTVLFILSKKSQFHKKLLKKSQFLRLIKSTYLATL
jgi:hypothetical protein